MFLLHPERRNFSEALNSCRTSNSKLAHVVSEVRTTALSELIKKLGENRGPKRAYVSLEDRKVEGRFITTMGNYDNDCFDWNLFVFVISSNVASKEFRPYSYCMKLAVLTQFYMVLMVVQAYC